MRNVYFSKQQGDTNKNTQLKYFLSTRQSLAKKVENYEGLTGSSVVDP